MAAQTSVSITCYSGGSHDSTSVCDIPTGSSCPHLGAHGRSVRDRHGARPAKETLTADEAIACIQTAVAARQASSKKSKETRTARKRLCEVKIVDQTGKRHKLHIDVQTKQVVKTK